MTKTQETNYSTLWFAAARMDPSLLGECYDCMSDTPDDPCISSPRRNRIMPVCTSASIDNRRLNWDELSVCTDGAEVQEESPILEYRTMLNKSRSALWTAAASMDASILGECYDCMTVEVDGACMPLMPQIHDIRVCTSGANASRILTWDELSVCTDDEATRMADSPILDYRVFSREIVALASTVLRAAQCAEYPLTRSLVKQSALLNLVANLHGMKDRLLLITRYERYRWTTDIDDALKAMYSKLRSNNRFMRPVYGYPSRQIKVFYAAGMRERSVCKDIATHGMDERLFLQACMALRRPC